MHVEVLIGDDLIRCQSGDRIVDLLQSHTGHQSFELETLAGFVGPEDVVVDVGAHVGTFALPLGRKAFRGRVIAIEATSSTYDLLAHNIERNSMANIEPVHALVGTGKLGRVAKQDPENTGATSYRAATGEGGTVPEPLDETLGRLLPEGQCVDVLKIDVEGMEDEVLASASETLSVARPVILVEIHVPSPHRRQRAYARLRRLDSLLGPLGYQTAALVPRADGSGDIVSIGSFRSLALHPGLLTDVLAIPPNYEAPMPSVLRGWRGRWRLIAKSFDDMWGLRRRPTE